MLGAGTALPGEGFTKGWRRQQVQRRQITQSGLTAKEPKLEDGLKGGCRKELVGTGHENGGGRVMKLRLDCHLAAMQIW